MSIPSVDATAAPQDLYPSRKGGEPCLLPRQDPVLHGETAGKTPGPLGEKELSQYAADGFLMRPAVFDGDEIAALRAEAERLREEAAQGAGRDDVIREPGLNVVRSIFAIHKADHALGQIARDSRLVSMAEQILGSAVYVHQSRINYKPPFDGKEFYWHSDFETWHAEDGMPCMRALSISVALTDNSAVNGPLMLIPGSHKHYVVCPTETPDDHFRQSLRKQEVGVPDEKSLTLLAEKRRIVAPDLSAGSVILFDCNTMHGSGGNLTPYPRSNLFIVYNSVHNALVAPFSAPSPRPEFIAARAA